MWTFLVSRVLQSLLALMALSVMVFYFTWATGPTLRPVGRSLGCMVKAPSTLGTFLRSFRVAASCYLLPVSLEESTPELIAQLRPV